MRVGPREYIAVLQNPRAGRGRHPAEVAAALAALRRTDREVRVLDAHTAADASRACHEAVASGAEALIVIGGDGTVHVAIQAVAGTGVPLGVVPAGTGNDFAAAVGVTSDLVRAAEAITVALLAGRTRPVDLARTTGPGGYDEWFAAVLAAGFDAIVNERANQMRWPRGRRRYDIAIFAELMRLKARRYRIVLRDTVGGADQRGTVGANQRDTLGGADQRDTLGGADQRVTLGGADQRDTLGGGDQRDHRGAEQRIEQDAILVAVGNTTSYGGGMKMCPAADPSDGLLDIVVAAEMSRSTLVRLQPRLYQGTHVRHPLVSSYRARTVEIHADGITGYADGERACPLPVTVTADPGALRLLV
ncbi:MAG: diacylglycerol kinase [Micromonosporaceae bacterium]|nr:diacylglycerol kinase [Micromonosporaceae bacterium]